MIYVDAREGLSGDMILAAMVGLLEGNARDEFTKDVSRAARTAGVEFQLTLVEEGGETGFAVSYASESPTTVVRSRQEAMGALRGMHPSGGSTVSRSLDAEILDALFRAEADAHELSIDQVHLHEVGRGGALTNMYGIGLAHSMLEKAGAGDFVCSTIVTGKGIVVIAHGAVRVPAPACAFLLKGLKHVTGQESGERATPTGIAAAKVLARTQSDEIPTEFTKRSIGFGTRRFGGRLGRTVMYWV